MVTQSTRDVLRRRGHLWRFFSKDGRWSYASRMGQLYRRRVLRYVKRSS